MTEKKCNHCNQKFTTSHACPATGRTITQDDTGDFAMSMAIGMATDNALLGAAIGGNIAGGIIGDMLAGNGGFFG